MSRLGKTPLLLPKGIEVEHKDEEVIVKGPKGTLKQFLPKGIRLRKEEDQLFIEMEKTSPLPNSMHGLYRSLLKNAIMGVSQGFEKQLSLVGVGYRAAVKGNVIDLQLGFSHPVQIKIPSGIEVAIEKSTAITIKGIDKQAVGQLAANIRAIRPPEPYKGKGARYEGEYVRKKAGKAAKGK